MTYAMGAELQRAIFERLTEDPLVRMLVQDAVFDAVPAVSPDLFIALGPERVTARADVSGGGAIHQVQLSVVTKRNGYSAAKTLAAAVSDALVDADLPLARGKVVSVIFQRAQARRDEGEGTRRIDLWFRARLDDQQN